MHHSITKQGFLAQLVEQRTENPCVPGSIPGETTLKVVNKRKSPILLPFLFLVLEQNGNRNSAFRRFCSGSGTIWEQILKIVPVFLAAKFLYYAGNII